MSKCGDCEYGALVWYIWISIWMSYVSVLPMLILLKCGDCVAALETVKMSMLILLKCGVCAYGDCENVVPVHNCLVHIDIYIWIYSVGMLPMLILIARTSHYLPLQTTHFHNAAALLKSDSLLCGSEHHD